MMGNFICEKTRIILYMLLSLNYNIYTIFFLIPPMLDENTTKKKVDTTYETILVCRQELGRVDRDGSVRKRNCRRSWPKRDSKITYQIG